VLSPQELAQHENMLAWLKRFPAHRVKEYEYELGQYAFAGQYQQSPTPRKGGIFKREYWQPYVPPVTGSRKGMWPDFDFIVVSVDSAFTEKEENDPTGCTTWGIWVDPTVGMGAEWSTGATLAMESWPARSRGFMGGVLQASWNLGFALASLAYWLLFDLIGWRGLLWLGILPALACVYIRFYVKEPAVWIENRKKQREQKQEVRAPLLAIFKPPLLADTLIAWWWVAGTLATYYSVFYLFPTWMQSDFKLTTAAIATPTMLANLVGLASVSFAWIADHIGRRPAIIMQAMIGCLVAPAYLLTSDLNWIIVGFIIQGIFGGALPLMTPAYLTERFPTEVRTTATGLCYQGGAVAASFIPPVISYFAVERHMGFALPMLIGTWLGSASVIIAVLMSPETKGKVFVPELMKA
jgi:MFS transporter, SHS family, lactate transporter